MELDGKKALVTGGTSGIGREVAKQLAELGAEVYVTGRDAGRGAEAVAEIEGAGAIAHFVAADLADFDAVGKLAEEVGAVDILVNNAGIFKFAPIDEFTQDEFHRQFNTNVLGLIQTTKEALKYFNPEGGSVINIGSTIVRSSPPGSVIYTATKGAVDSITHVLANELAPRKIRVNGLNPGGVETEGAISAGVVGGDFEKRIVAGTPLGRMGQPNDIAPVAVFLASDDSGWVTGETLLVSGGLR
jgi:3-oxoacyl-[acyl-carrier protein] reductase